MSTGALSPGVMRPGRDADHLLPSSADAKKERNYTSTAPYAFIAWFLLSIRDTCAFTFLIFELCRVGCRDARCGLYVTATQRTIMWTRALLMIMMTMSMWWDFVSELRPPTDLLFVPQKIHEHGEPWWNDIERGKLVIRPSELRVNHTSSHLVVNQEELEK
jgi:hypothetical protein